jgi:hypothetical protein
LDQGLATSAGPFAAHMTVNTEDARHVVQLLRHIFTNALEGRAAAWGCAHCGIGLVRKDLTR